MTNHPDLLSDYFKDDVSPRVPNNNKEEIKLADTTSNDHENSRLMGIDKQRPITLNLTFRNGLLSELSRNFREVIFSESKFLVGIPVLDIRYIHSRSQSSNPFHLFND